MIRIILILILSFNLFIGNVFAKSAFQKIHNQKIIKVEYGEGEYYGDYNPFFMVYYDNNYAEKIYIKDVVQELVIRKIMSNDENDDN